MPSRQMWAVVHYISLPDRRCARMADRDLCAGRSSANTKLSSSSTLSQASVRTPPNGASIPKQVRSQRVAGVSGDSSSNKRGRMQTLKIAGVLALILLPSTMARAQGMHRAGNAALASAESVHAVPPGRMSGISHRHRLIVSSRA